MSTPEDVLAAWAEAKARIWREADHPRGPDGRFIRKAGAFSTVLDKFAAAGLPVFDSERLERSLETDAPGLASLDALPAASELIEDPDDAKAYLKTLKRTAIALDTAKMVEEASWLEGTPPVAELNRQKRAALNTLGARLGFTPEETDEAAEWLTDALRSWSIGGGLVGKRRDMLAAAAHLRAGGKAVDAPTRAMLLQKAYTDVVWGHVHGDKPVNAVRVIGGHYGERLRAAVAAGDDWELETWPLTSWAEERAKKSLISRWAGDTDMLMARPVSRDEAWLIFNGEGSFRTRGLKAPGELILDDRLALTAEHVELEDLTAGNRLRGDESLRGNFTYLRDRHPDATEAQRYAAYVATASPQRLELLGVKDGAVREEGYEQFRMPYLATHEKPRSIGRLSSDDVPLDAYAGAFESGAARGGREMDRGADLKAEFEEAHGVTLGGYSDERWLRQLGAVDLERSTVTLVPPDGTAPTYYDRNDATEMSAAEFVRRQRTGELEGWTFYGAEVAPDPDKLNAGVIETYDRALEVIRERDLDQDTLDFAIEIDNGGSRPAMRRAVKRAGWTLATPTLFKDVPAGTRYYDPDPKYPSRLPENRRVYVIDESDVDAEMAEAYERAMDARLLVGNEELVDAAEYERAFGKDDQLRDRGVDVIADDGYAKSDIKDQRRLVLDPVYATGLHPEAVAMLKVKP